MHKTSHTQNNGLFEINKLFSGFFPHSSKMVCHVNSSATVVVLFLICYWSGEMSVVLGDGTPEDWARLKEWGLDMANNGQKDGEPCEPRASNYAALQNLRFALFDLTELSGSYNIAEFEKDLNPSKKTVVCAAKHNLICTNVQNKCRSCAAGDLRGDELEDCRIRVQVIVEKLQ